MAMSLGGATRGGGRRRRRPRRAAMSEINVTPFVDVMLVLLIVFMVAAPLMTVGVPIDLPQASASALENQTDPISISVDAEGTVHIQELPVDIDELVPRLQALAENGVESRVNVRGDTAASYGMVAEVMARIAEAGFTRIGLVTSGGSAGASSGGTSTGESN